jgi:HEAT repeat
VTTNLPTSKLLKDKAKDVRLWTVGLIRKLANHGEGRLDYCPTANQDYTAEFHHAVASSIPLLVKPLEDKAEDIRCETVKAIGELADHSE